MAIHGEKGWRICGSLPAMPPEQKTLTPPSRFPVLWLLPLAPGLTCSLECITTILTVVDQFSKMVHFISPPSGSHNCLQNFLETWYQTGGLNSFLDSKRCSALCLWQRLVSPPDTIPQTNG